MLSFIPPIYCYFAPLLFSDPTTIYGEENPLICENNSGHVAWSHIWRCSDPV